MLSVEFYFDLTCPWSYLAFVRLNEAALRTGAAIEWRPVCVDSVRLRANPDRPAGREPDDPRKAAYATQDIECWADYVGIRIDRPEDWPADASVAAAGAVVADRHGQAAAYCDAVFAAYFGLGMDIGKPDVIVELAEKAGLDSVEFARQLTDDAPSDSIAGNEDRLLARGGFGTPTMFVAEQMFFGNDRMPLVEFALGQCSGRTFVMPGQHG